MSRRKARRIAASVSADARALEDHALSEERRANLLARIQQGGNLTDVEIPDLPAGTGWLADRARRRRGTPSRRDVDALKADLMDRAAQMNGYSSHAERVAAEER